MSAGNPASVRPPINAARAQATYVNLATANFFAQLADQVALAAAPLLLVLSFAAGVEKTGVMGVAQTLPYLLFALQLGVWADRGSRTRLLRASEFSRLFALVCISLVALAQALIFLASPVPALRERPR
jgi:hypothetical protein